MALIRQENRSRTGHTLTETIKGFLLPEYVSIPADKEIPARLVANIIQEGVKLPRNLSFEEYLDSYGIRTVDINEQVRAQLLEKIDKLQKKKQKKSAKAANVPAKKLRRNDGNSAPDALSSTELLLQTYSDPDQLHLDSTQIVHWDSRFDRKEIAEDDVTESELELLNYQIIADLSDEQPDDDSVQLTVQDETDLSEVAHLDSDEEADLVTETPEIQDFRPNGFQDGQKVTGLFYVSLLADDSVVLVADNGRLDQDDLVYITDPYYQSVLKQYMGERISCILTIEGLTDQCQQAKYRQEQSFEGLSYDSNFRYEYQASLYPILSLLPTNPDQVKIDALPVGTQITLTGTITLEHSSLHPTYLFVLDDGTAISLPSGLRFRDSQLPFVDIETSTIRPGDVCTIQAEVIIESTITTKKLLSKTTQIIKGIQVKQDSLFLTALSSKRINQYNRAVEDRAAFLKIRENFAADVAQMYDLCAENNFEETDDPEGKIRYQQARDIFATMLAYDSKNKMFTKDEVDTLNALRITLFPASERPLFLGYSHRSDLENMTFAEKKQDEVRLAKMKQVEENKLFVQKIEELFYPLNLQEFSRNMFYDEVTTGPVSFSADSLPQYSFEGTYSLLIQNEFTQQELLTFLISCIGARLNKIATYTPDDMEVDKNRAYWPTTPTRNNPLASEKRVLNAAIERYLTLENTVDAHLDALEKITKQWLFTEDTQAVLLANRVHFLDSLYLLVNKTTEMISKNVRSYTAEKKQSIISVLQDILVLISSQKMIEVAPLTKVIQQLSQLILNLENGRFRKRFQ